MIQFTSFGVQLWIVALQFMVLAEVIYRETEHKAVACENLRPSFHFRRHASGEVRRHFPLFAQQQWY